jgi:uncharacterized iron-regulated membrane protein
MKGSFRQSMSWLHTWSGLVLGWILYFMFVTGSAGYFDTEIDYWMQPETPFASAAIQQSQMLGLAERRLDQVAADATEWYIDFPVIRVPSLAIWWLNKIDPETGKASKWESEVLNPLTGDPVTVRDTGGGRLLYRMHYTLHYMPALIAYWLTSLCAMFMLIALISGIVIHKKIFKDFFTFRPGKKQRSWLDMHNVLSVLPLPFYLMITYSGLILLMSSSMPGVIGASYGLEQEGRQQFFEEVFSREEGKKEAGISADNIALASVLPDVQQRWGNAKLAYIEIEKKGDINAHIEVGQAGYDGIGHSPTLTYNAVTGELQGSKEANNKSVSFQFYQIMEHLHEGLFAGTVLRCLYFLSGLMGAGMIATGMVLWASKRREKAQKTGWDSRGLKLVEVLNVGTITGLPIAIAAYFLANRILPVGMVNRADKEVLVLFIVWGLTLIYPALRYKWQPIAQVWVEMLSACAVIFTIIPLVNMFTTDRHLINSLAQGDWVMAGFDLTVFAIGCAFAVAVSKMRQLKLKPVPLVTERIVS